MLLNSLLMIGHLCLPLLCGGYGNSVINTFVFNIEESYSQDFQVQWVKTQYSEISQAFKSRQGEKKHAVRPTLVEMGAS